MQLTLQIPPQPPQPPPVDRGQCSDLDADTGKRCEGRMVASYRAESTYNGVAESLVSYGVWTCSVCGKVVIP